MNDTIKLEERNEISSLEQIFINVINQNRIQNSEYKSEQENILNKTFKKCTEIKENFSFMEKYNVSITIDLIKDKTFIDYFLDYNFYCVTLNYSNKTILLYPSYSLYDFILINSNNDTINYFKYEDGVIEIARALSII